MATYLISGATGGIGEAICRRLAKDHRLVLVARDRASLDTLTASLGGTHLRIPVDMASDVSVAGLAAAMEREQLLLDGLVLMPPQPHADGDPMPAPEVWRDLFQTSFIGPCLC